MHAMQESWWLKAGQRQADGWGGRNSRAIEDASTRELPQLSQLSGLGLGVTDLARFGAWLEHQDECRSGTHETVASKALSEDPARVFCSGPCRGDRLPEFQFSTGRAAERPSSSRRRP